METVLGKTAAGVKNSLCHSCCQHPINTPSMNLLCKEFSVQLLDPLYHHGFDTIVQCAIADLHMQFTVVTEVKN